MQATIDGKGRMEIPRELRDRLHLTPGALVDLQPGENGFSVTPVSNGAVFVPATTTLVREGSVLDFGGSAPLSVDDVNAAIVAGRAARIDEIADGDSGRRTAIYF